MRRRLAATVLLAPLCAAGCGSTSSKTPAAPSAAADSNPATRPPAAASTPASAATPATFPTVAATTAAQKALLAIGDFPAGWATTAPDAPATDRANSDAALAGCLHVPVAVISARAHDAVNVQSPQFSFGAGNATVNEKITVSPKTRVTQLLAALRGPGVSNCLATTLSAAVGRQVATSSNTLLRQATVGNVTVGQLSAGHYGDDTLGFRVTVPLTGPSLTLTVYLDEIYIAQGGAVASLTYDNVYSPLDTATSNQLTSAAANKLLAARIPAL